MNWLVLVDFKIMYLFLKKNLVIRKRLYFLSAIDFKDYSK